MSSFGSFGSSASTQVVTEVFKEGKKRREIKKAETRGREVSALQKLEEEETGAAKRGAETRLSRFRNINALIGGGTNQQLSTTGATGSFGRRLSAR